MARFFRRGISKIKFAPAVAGASPTRAEITAGTDLSPSVSGIAGFALNNAPIETPNLADRFTTRIPGPDAVAASTLTFNDDDTSTAIRTALANGTTGFILLFPYGDVAGKRVEVWPVTSTGVNDEWNMGNDPARFTVEFAVTGVPNQGGVTPA